MFFLLILNWAMILISFDGLSVRQIAALIWQADEVLQSSIKNGYPEKLIDFDAGHSFI
ncbi:hypothetical protein [Nitrosomonas sp.]|uniref:hypothetical protein n=1 Tax=Nitrosomonas sp. TaxID=42353 RepID=UPI0025FCCA70|nr:hypothetical protein [Nitrosomonas sp.]